MKRMRRSVIVLVLCVLLILAVLLSRVWIARDEESANLPYYVAAEELDPIFAIEGTDPSKLRVAVATLLSQRDQIAKFYSSDQGTVITDTIYPSKFLNDLPDLEEARQTLIASSTVANAELYHSRLIQTIDDYAAGARALSASVGATATQFPTIGYFGGLSSTTDMAIKLQTVADEALSQRTKEEARYACLEQMSSNCTPLAALSEERQAALQTPSRLPAPGTQIDTVDSLTQKILPLLPGFVSIEKPIFAISSDCYNASPAYVRAYYLTQTQGGIALKLAGINDAYFYDNPKLLTLNPTSKLQHALVAAGALTKYQSIGNLYMCPDSGADVASVDSMLGVLSALRDLPNKAPEVSHILALPVVQKADIAPYIAESAATGTPAFNDLAERYIEGSADFDQVVLSAYSDNRMFILASKSGPPAEHEYMLIVRNFASVLFLLGNPTFAPQPMSFFTAKEPDPLQKLLLRSYLNDLSNHYTDQQLVQQTKTDYAIDASFGL